MDKLLLVGALSDEDVERLLILIHPESWDPTFEKGELVFRWYEPVFELKGSSLKVLFKLGQLFSGS